jgi:hypothetical protein
MGQANVLQTLVYTLLCATPLPPSIFGASSTTSLTIVQAGMSSAGDNLLFLGNTLPVDSHGLGLNLSSPVQLPGGDPFLLTSLLTPSTVSNVVRENGSSQVDGSGTFISVSFPGFGGVSVGP